MTPEEHYAKADEIVTFLDDVGPERPMEPEQMANLLLSAQVHATLATARGPMTDEEIARASGRGSRTLGRR